MPTRVVAIAGLCPVRARFRDERGDVGAVSQRYPGLKQSPLVHSFNDPLPSGDVPQAVGAPMKVAICGNVNTSCDDAAARFGEAIATLRTVCLSIYSGTI